MNGPVDVPPLLLNRRQTARAMGISVRLLHSCTKAKEIPHVRIARRVLYDPRDLSAWIEAKKNRSP
jgi:hypothetical protein